MCMSCEYPICIRHGAEAGCVLHIGVFQGNLCPLPGPMLRCSPCLVASRPCIFLLGLASSLPVPDSLCSAEVLPLPRGIKATDLLNKHKAMKFGVMYRQEDLSQMPMQAPMQAPMQVPMQVTGEHACMSNRRRVKGSSAVLGLTCTFSSGGIKSACSCVT